MSLGYPLLVEPELHRGPLYRYLEKSSFADTWVRSGQIPIRPASAYLSAERKGILTPDEVTQAAYVGVSRAEIDAHFALNGQVVLINSVLGDRRVSWGHAIHQEQDALIMCFSSEKSADLMHRLGKGVCVEIPDIHYLKRCLDAQVGAESFFGRVHYATGDNRAHFLKHRTMIGNRRFVWSGL